MLHIQAAVPLIFESAVPHSPTGLWLPVVAEALVVIPEVPEATVAEPLQIMVPMDKVWVAEAVLNWTVDQVERKMAAVEEVFPVRQEPAVRAVPAPIPAAVVAVATMAAVVAVATMTHQVWMAAAVAADPAMPTHQLPPEPLIHKDISQVMARLSYHGPKERPVLLPPEHR
jgi:hypothetical protein